MKKVRLSSNCIVLLERSKSRRERDSRTSTIPLFAGWLVYFSFFSTDYTLFFDGVLVSGWYCTILRTSCGSCTGQGCRCNNICSDFFYYSYIPFFGWIYYQTSISFWGFLAHIYEVFSSLHLQTCQSESASLQLLFPLRRLDYADWTQHSRLWILYTCMCSSSTWSGYHEDGFSVFLWGDRWCFLPLVHLLESQGYSALGSPPEMIGIISVWVSFGTLPGLSPKMIVFGICSLHPT